MSFEDRTFVCSQCGVEFVFTAGEQDFYQKKGFTHPPRRCRKCRGAKHTQGSHRGLAPGAHLEYIGTSGAAGEKRAPRARTTEPVDATCSSCGAATKLPFKPDGVRPVFCRACYQQRRRSSTGRP